MRGENILDNLEYPGVLDAFLVSNGKERERERGGGKEKKHVTRNPGLPALESLSLVEVTH